MLNQTHINEARSSKLAVVLNRTGSLAPVRANSMHLAIFVRLSLPPGLAEMSHELGRVHTARPGHCP
ncbi:hypothetical protein V496_00021 [Pseudogymnoascus sp. VKM F-4515 (FW-2607)]|nr:hypothetical protein V496_00021 [Pseudogymnoascus sp. VKM F-4515 (FW-2607)]